MTVPRYIIAAEGIPRQRIIMRRVWYEYLGEGRGNGSTVHIRNAVKLGREG